MRAQHTQSMFSTVSVVELCNFTRLCFRKIKNKIVPIVPRGARFKRLFHKSILIIYVYNLLICAYYMRLCRLRTVQPINFFRRVIFPLRFVFAAGKISSIRYPFVHSIFRGMFFFLYITDTTFQLTNAY